MALYALAAALLDVPELQLADLARQARPGTPARGAKLTNPQRTWGTNWVKSKLWPRVPAEERAVFEADPRQRELSPGIRLLASSVLAEWAAETSGQEAAQPPAGPPAGPPAASCAAGSDTPSPARKARVRYLPLQAL